ncbi:MAG: FtsW/RodA/SpoVE family cell cycle protein [Coriobacteriia bacterium]|nr:FtsW/RodA/SpoVE family cell cycle protein [Coriobacteriia bacterium]MCL2749596.1 FtsW/RodA/SpoVE family cell cycle protein [Coriobacteriia bacterium]
MSTRSHALSHDTQSGLTRRSLELLLLLAASPVVILIFILAILANDQPLELNALAVPLGLFAAFLTMHLAVRRLAPGADPALLPLCFAISGIGIAFVLRLAPELAGRQVIWLFVAIAAMILTLFVVRSVKKLGDYKYTIIIAGLILLLLPAVIGTEIGGSKIWITIAGFSFQPGEIAKIFIVLFLAAYFAENREMLSVSGRRVGRFNIPDLRTLAPLLLMWGISMVIVVFQRDLGSALLFFGIFLAMLYVATGRMSFVVAAVLLAATGAVLAWSFFSHVQARVDIWLDPFAYAQNASYQLVQALYSLADGDVLGTGIGRGMPTFIPVVESDFIFVAMAEEMGFLGAAGILLLFVLLAVRGFTIASRAASDTEAFSAAGLTVSLSFQAFVIVGGTTLLIPLTGVTLPFMSQGGTSLLASFIIIGLLLRISDSGTGLENELQATVNLDGGVLGRLALGKRLTALITILSLFFALAIGNLAYQMFIHGETIRSMPANSHAIAREATAQRGAIITADGVVLAESIPNGDGTYTRVYPQGDLAAHIVGYSSARYGSTGIEASMQEQLRGETNFSTWTQLLNSLAGIQNPGNDVRLTIDSRMQYAAQNALAGYHGGVVVLDAQTGELLAAAGSPTYNLNNAEAILEAAASADPGNPGPLFNRATQGLYSPGSTFKIVTLTGALYGGDYKLADTIDAPGVLEIGGAKVVNFASANYGTVTIKQAFELSSNTAFAQIANTMGPQKLVSIANSFGFDRTIGRDFLVTTSLMPSPALMTVWETAWAGAGEPVGEHKDSPAGPQATVVQMALVGAAIANNGTIMNPYVVNSVMAANGSELTSTKPETFGNVASAAVITEVQWAMEGVVASGTGTAAQIAGYTVRGKSGTAETGRAVPDSWFVGYVDTGSRCVVVAIVLEEAGEGAATPRARDILQTAIQTYG